MRVRLAAMGQLEKDFGGGRFDFEFPPDSTLADLLERIGDEFSERLPESLWNRAERRFRGAVVMMSGGGALRDPAQPLRDGQEILVFKVLVGG